MSNYEPTEWWSIPQAVAWIVTRDPEAVRKVRHVETLAALKHEKLPARSDSARPPVTLQLAPYELLRRAGERRIEVRGRKYGVADEQCVPVENGFTIGDHRGHVSIGGPGMYRDNDPYWSALFGAAAECKAIWRPVSVPKAPFRPTKAPPPIRTVGGYSLHGATQKPKITSTTSANAAGDEQQRQFNVEKQRRIDEDEKHDFDAMTLWARHNLKVSTARSEQLWAGRSETFSRERGRPAGARKKTGKSGKT